MQNGRKFTRWDLDFPGTLPDSLLSRSRVLSGLAYDSIESPYLQTWYAFCEHQLDLNNSSPLDSQGFWWLSAQ